MTPKDFIKSYWKDAENDLGFDPLIVLTQAAMESGWGVHAPGNMFFGQKDTDGINGNEQLLDTTEVSKYNNLLPKQVGLENIEKIVPSTINGQKYFTYYGKSYFRKFGTPHDCFVEHLNFFLKNSRYIKACQFRDNPEVFFKEIALAGYATDPLYASQLIETYKYLNFHLKEYLNS